MSRWTVAVFVIGCATTGCATVPAKGGFTDVQQLLVDRIEQRVHWYQGTPEDAQVAAVVEALLGSELSVAQAVQIALLNNRTLQAAYEDLGVAQADLVQAGLLRNPVFFASARRGDLPQSGTNTEFEIVEEFLHLLTRPLRTRIASLEFEEAKLRAADAVVRLAADVKSAFYMLQGRLQVAEMLRVIARAADAGAGFAQRQHAAGNLNDLDLATREGLAEQATVDLERLDGEIVADRERLNRLLGVWGAGARWSIATALPPVPDADQAAEDLEALAIANRLDLAAARLEVEQLARALDLTVRWRWFPVAEVGVSTERESDGLRVTGPSLRIELPIFDQGQARIARLESLNRRSQQDMMALAVRVRSEVRQAHQTLAVYRGLARRYADAIIPLRERIVSEALKHYNYMLLGVYVLLDAKRDEVAAYREYIEVTRDYWLARADLELALGGRLRAVEPELN